ncbi:phytanoyl-CoA dioxygenase family protein [Mucilaginibacter rubeus]|uniref:Phytanoyl-CoA dioxygenase family protein n=1 Tax=Mucilaginibacter rubeus TaxID=2027860 RepID=A0AAE6MII8_9SPHI|nr:MULTISPECIES: phytanoyl-CoA dioxygenase family protein [Mucilaginibacter]QEM04608.1 phytanoyl-CoA dioxygenase family protein [Mucilaginibacter rubeus]QEM17201.1 phytanoyl-CoA dioxygenase family protein [Mucilaginibacter gossypii]QTE46294.1 phytanoyl-CoA dioxygenase family protein [Mucilaginibacter rubeus]QTE52891.1 phytanoyl-CoA dioxygenase family protein [Mucilaginibacter rubeus]QTE57977.1 phytanoyl-CoA dioxygenase family protein [Mucilaginibacter rubeus]
MDITRHQYEIVRQGFSVVEHIYTDAEVKVIVAGIENVDKASPLFRQTDDLFAIRQFLKAVPEISPLIFTGRLKTCLQQLFGDGYFAVKSIYFDKPGSSNWFVAWHQDLTISVDKKIEITGYGPGTVKHNQFAVQPPLHILQDNFTIRIHLDDTDEGNGALKVLPGSHLKEIYRPENIDWQQETEVSCNVQAGGIMIMRPLLMHASNRTTNSKRRRVVHIEFSRATLADGIDWAERIY